MKPITADERRAALEQMLAADRVQLAGLIERIAIHRDVLESPATTIADLEERAEKSVRVIERLESRLAELGPASE